MDMHYCVYNLHFITIFCCTCNVEHVFSLSHFWDTKIILAYDFSLNTKLIKLLHVKQKANVTFWTSFTLGREILYSSHLLYTILMGDTLHYLTYFDLREGC